MSLQNFGVVTRIIDARLLRSAQPDAEAWSSLRLLGVTHVVKLNRADEYDPAIEEQEAGPDVVVIKDDASQFDPTPQWCSWIVEWLQRALYADQTVLLHCTHGIDRTALVVGAWRILVEHWLVEAVLAEAQHYGWGELREVLDHEIIECWRKLAATVQSAGT